MTLFIPVLLGSSRIGRRSLHVARFVVDCLREYDQVETQVLDLAEYDFPIMEQRLDHTDTPPPGLEEFSQTLRSADGLLIVSPEYKGGYPGVLKNAFDYLPPSILRYKPVGICTVSSTEFGGLQCLSQLRLVTLALGGLSLPDALPIPKVQEAFDEKGQLRDSKLKQQVQPFLDELVWYVEAMVNQRKKTQQQKAA